MIRDEDAFCQMDVVETEYSGKVTRHTILKRFRTRNSQSGVTYQVVPAVPKSSGPKARIDHAWFKKIGFQYLDGNDIKFESTQ